MSHSQIVQELLHNLTKNEVMYQQGGNTKYLHKSIQYRNKLQSMMGGTGEFIKRANDINGKIQKLIPETILDDFAQKVNTYIDGLERQIADLNTDIDDKEAEIHRLTQELADAGTAGAATQALRDQLLRLQQELAAKNTELGAVKLELDTTKAQLDGATTRISQLDTTIAQLTATNQTLKADCDAALDKIDEKADEVSAQKPDTYYGQSSSVVQDLLNKMTGTKPSFATPITSSSASPVLPAAAARTSQQPVASSPTVSRIPSQQSSA